MLADQLPPTANLLHKYAHMKFTQKQIFYEMFNKIPL